MTSSSPFDVAAIAADRAALVRFARSLLADAAGPEDAVQDAWVAALRRGQAASGHRLPWMMTVLRNLVHRRHRDRNRRRAREGAYHAASEHPALAADDALERLEIQRRLVEAVQRLDEPFRSTVVWIYFEGLSPSELATRTGVPAGTVRWRLKTALDRVRASLAEGSTPDWRRALAIVAVDRPSALGPTLAMKASTKGLVVLGSIVAVLLTGALVARRLAQPPTPDGSPVGASVARDDDLRPGTPAASGPRPGGDPRAASAPPRFLAPPGDAGPASGAATQEVGAGATPASLASRVDPPADADELARRARLCEVRWDVPGAKSDDRFQNQGWATDQDLAALGLPEAELGVARRAIARYKEALAAELRRAIQELEGRLDPSLGSADVDALEEYMVHLIGRRRPGELRRARRDIAAELAGLRPPREDARRSLGERLYLGALTRGDDFERDLAREVGERRAAELRSILSGRQTNAGCPER